MAPPSYWLMKTEPDVFSFADLMSRPRRTEGWDGIRNYQARNMLRDEFAVGDLAFIYHSRVDEPAVVGTARVVRSGYLDRSALDRDGKYFDPKSLALGESRWYMVDVQAIDQFRTPVTLAMMRAEPSLEGLMVTKKGQRLSIQPVSESHWRVIRKMGRPEELSVIG